MFRLTKDKGDAKSFEDRCLNLDMRNNKLEASITTKDKKNFKIKSNWAAKKDSEY